jgi:iron(III) transport system permease protein
MAVRESRPAVFAAAAAVALVAALPLVYVLVRAAGAGSATWSDLLDGRVPTLLSNTLGLAAIVCAATLATGATLAYLVVRTDLPGRRAVAVLAALPLAIPPYVGAVAYADVLGPRGGLRDLLGVEELPSIFGLAGAALALSVFTYPYVFLLAVAALRNLNPSYEEAARGLGRGPFDAVAGTAMRMIAPALAGGTLLVGLYVLSDFGAVSIMRYDTFTTVIYEELGGRFDPPGAAALSSVLVLLTLVLLVAGLRARGRGSFEQTGAGFARESPRRLGRWRWPAFAAVAALLALALALPLARLATWTVEVAGDQDLAEYWGWAANSLLVSVLAATVAAGCALPVALVMARAHATRGQGGAAGRIGVALSWLAQAGYALPGVIVALAMVAISTRFVDPLYGTLALLVSALVIRFLPQAIQGEEAGLQQIGGNLVEAARGLGASRGAAFRSVVVPLLRPSLAVAWAVVFLTSIKELPATLVLRPLGFDTLPVRVWTPARDGLYADAGPAALLLVIVSVIPLYLLLARRRGVVPALA